MKFQLELVSLQDGYHVLRTELNTDVSDSVLQIPINTHKAVWLFMAEIERNIDGQMFNLVDKIKTENEYKLTYETIPILELKH